MVASDELCGVDHELPLVQPDHEATEAQKDKAIEEVFISLRVKFDPLIFSSISFSFTTHFLVKSKIYKFLSYYLLILIVFVITFLQCQLRSEVSKLDERLKLSEDHLKQKVLRTGTSMPWKLENHVKQLQY